MLVENLKALQIVLSDITGIPIDGANAPEEAIGEQLCKIVAKEPAKGSIDVAEQVSIINNEWVGIDQQAVRKAYPSARYYRTDNKGQNKYGIYYEDMPSAVGNPKKCIPTPDNYGNTQADLNWLLYNTKNRGINSGVKNTDDLYEMIVANHRVSKFKDTPNGIPIIKTNSLIAKKI